MKGEGISGQDHWNAIVGREVNGGSPGRTDALDGNLLGSERYAVILRLVDDGVDQILIGSMRVGAAHHRDAL